jgi:hypothetical protein
MRKHKELGVTTAVIFYIFKVRVTHLLDIVIKNSSLDYYHNYQHDLHDHMPNIQFNDLNQHMSTIVLPATIFTLSFVMVTV